VNDYGESWILQTFEEYCLLGCDVLKYGRNSMIFQRHSLPPLQFQRVTRASRRKKHSERDTERERERERKR
jgi:hypothetical protein